MHHTAHSPLCGISIQCLSPKYTCNCFPKTINGKNMSKACLKS